MDSMKSNMTVLAQIVKFIPDRIIENLAEAYRIHARAFSATSHVMAMLYAHLGHSLSLNDICDDLRLHSGPLSQIRNCTPPSRNGLSYANQTRNADMAEELFWRTYESLAEKYPEFLTSSRNYPGLPHRFKRTIYAVDSTTIKLTADSMGWAKHRRQKAAAKMHTELNMRSFLPNFVIVKGAKDSDPKTAYELCATVKAGEVVVFDKAYVDFGHLNILEERGVFWVTRAKENMQYKVVGQHLYKDHGIDYPASKEKKGKAKQGRGGDGDGKNMGQQQSFRRSKRRYVRKECRIISDEDIILCNSEKYPRCLRLVTADVEIQGKMATMKFITDNMEWAPYTICQLYQCRWGVEVFFKEIKQTLQLSDFLGYSENAVRWQVWTALLAYLLLRFTAWLHKWKHQFIRFFTFVRACLWNYFNLLAVINNCDMAKARRHIVRGSPATAYQLEFNFS